MRTLTSTGKPFKRTRTGCLTCREDGYRCDEQKPSCARCLRLGKFCKGYGLKLKWQSPMGPQRIDKKSEESHRRRTPSTALTRLQSQRPAASVSPRAMSSGIPPHQQYLLHHWSNTLASLITLSPPAQNMFHTHVTPMITHSPPLLSSICSMAASHLSVLRNDRSLKNIATWHQNDAIAPFIRNMGTETPLASLAALATILILHITDRLFKTNTGVNHLEGAKIIINQAEPKTWDCDTGIFLLSVCSYHDAVVSVSRRTPPILNLGSHVPFLEEMTPMRGLKILWTVVGRISSMCSQDRSLLDGEGAVIESVLQTIATLASREGDGGHTIHAYIEAAYIYLHRVWHNVGSPHPQTLRHARDCLEHLFKVPVSSPLVSAHPWPLLTAGCETIDENLRDLVRKRIQAMYDSRHMPSLLSLEEDIEEVWRDKDKKRTATGIDKVDCIQAILAIRQRGPDLA
ncbi:fungal-specific transcription factor domain-containing protein [Xylaria sp. FL1042]|nr:fungal-specific transcription factor domain-containing protein [Xylaria sp. FL1042]